MMKTSYFDEVMEDFCKLDIANQGDTIKHFYDSFNKENMPIENIFRSVRFNSLDLSECISKEYKSFNVGNKLEEETVSEVFRKFKSNTYPKEILPKVVIINQLYSTRLNSNPSGRTISVIEMTRHIKAIWDEKKPSIKTLDAVEMVDMIGNLKHLKFDREVNNAYSFASKYLSFTCRFNDEENYDDRVPITDTYSRNTFKRICKNGLKKQKICLDNSDI
nr:hypothetical protein [Lachnospiraceae bacterium]